MTTFGVKDWKNDPDHTTPLSAAAMEDLETRLSNYTDAHSLGSSYTPGLFNGTNVATSTPRLTFYTRVGDIVRVSGTMTVDATTTALSTTLDVALPIPSNLATVYDLTGVGTTSGATTFENWQFIANFTNDRATATAIVGTAAAHDVAFTFTYVVI